MTSSIVIKVASTSAMAAPTNQVSNPSLSSASVETLLPVTRRLASGIAVRDVATDFYGRVTGTQKSTSATVPADIPEPFTSAVTSALNSLNSTQTITTPIIVAIVFGVLGGIIIIGLALWFLCRRRNKREARRRYPSPDLYGSEELDEPPSKAELEEFAREESPQRVESIRTALDFSQAPTERTSESRPQPAGHQHSERRASQQQPRRVVQEEDAESFVEYLPPQYRAWQAGGQTGIDFSRPPDTWDADHRLSTSSRLQVNDTVTGPEQTPALRNEPVVIAPLKRELMRPFGRTVPQRVTRSGSASDLWSEHKRRFT